MPNAYTLKYSIAISCQLQSDFGCNKRSGPIQTYNIESKLNLRKAFLISYVTHVNLKTHHLFCPTTQKTNICISDSIQTTFFYLGRLMKKLADDQCSSITNGSISSIPNMYIQPSTTVVDWPEIRYLMEVSTMVYICRYCVFTWWDKIENI